MHKPYRDFADFMVRVDLRSINKRVLECLVLTGAFDFAGEVIDVDAITGGFNLQAAWTMGYVVGQHIGEQ
jgi:predicted flavoprotein YhiN